MKANLKNIRLILGRLVRRVVVEMPWSHEHIVFENLDREAKSIIDLGCGDGEPMRFINKNKQFYSVGLDIFEPCLKVARDRRSHDEYLLADVRWLPFKSKSFDIVLCLEVIEHLEQNEGEKLLREMERIARKQVILSTPAVPFKQGQSEIGGNPFQRHKTYWPATKFAKLGYEVKACWLIRILISKHNFPLWHLAFMVNYVIDHYFPAWIGRPNHIVCIKRLAEGAKV